MGTWSRESADYDVKDVKVLNGGVAGEVQVTAVIERKGADAKENAPDVKFVFTDANGGSVNYAIWLTEPTSEQQEEGAKKTIRNLRHIVKNSIGESTLMTLPNEFPSFSAYAEALINLLNANGFSNGHYTIFTTYGTGYKHSKYIGVRSYPPFIRTTGQGDTMTAGSIDKMEAPQADATSGDAAPAVSAPAGNW